MHLNNKQAILLLYAILLLATILRFYQLPKMANFDFDQQYASNFAYSVLKEYPIQLIGQGLSIEGLFMGPLYFYYLVPFYSLTHLHPIGGYIASVILGLITVVVYFWVAKEIFGNTAAVIAAYFRGLLFSFIGIDWTLTPAFSSDIMVIVIFYLFYKYWHGNTQSLILLFFCFGLFTSFHPILFPFYLVFIAVIILKRKFPKPKTILYCLIAFLLPISPLIRFEFLHNFLEIKQLFSLFGGHLTGYKDYVASLKDYINIILSEPQRVFGISNIPRTIFSFFLFASLIVLNIKKVGFWKDNFHRIFPVITFLAFIFYYVFFPGHVPEYYFSGIVILIVFYTAGSLSLLDKKAALLLIISIIIISIFNLQLLFNRWNNPALITLFHKDFIVKEILKR